MDTSSKAIGTKPLFVLRYNGRDDDLGDQFIYKALADSLAEFGTVIAHKEAPAFMPFMRSAGSGLRSKWIRLKTRISGGSVYDVLPPGAVLRPKAKKSTNHRVDGIRGAIHRSLRGKKVSVGRSVIPEADHSWCQSIAWLGVRDQDSIRAIQAAGYDHVRYFPDLAFMVPPSYPPSQPNSIERIGISFRRRIPEDSVPGRYEQQMDAAMKTLLPALKQSAPTRLLGYHQVEEDDAHMRELSEEHGIEVSNIPVTLDSYQSFYQSLDLVISNRLHCLLMGALCGAIPLALTTRQHTKVVSLYETIGWNSLIAYGEDVDSIAAVLRRLRENATEVRTMVRQTLACQRELGRAFLCLMGESS